MSKRVFVSYATADRKQALSVCKALERRGADCWISTRDVPAGENYQEAIVRSLRAARAMVLVFSDAANNSDEIKKELSLASRYHVPVLALRIEDVEPSDAFAYELSTRQWIDAFAGWDRSLDSLARRIAEMAGATGSKRSIPSVRRRAWSSSRSSMIAAAAVVLVLAIGAIWWLSRPAPVAAHSMMVRLAGFQRLSPDLPPSLPDAVRDEVITAFGDQGLIGVSTASAPEPGSKPAYALGGTIRRDGDRIRVITRLSNERSGATLWSISTDYDTAQAARVPRRIAVDAAKMVRCGLFAASTYSKPLPDPVLSDYMDYCETAGVFQIAPTKGFDSARKVTAAAPDFSWGWSAVAMAAFLSSPDPERRHIGLQAVDKALSLDPKNSEALSMKAMFIDHNDRIRQEQLLKQAIAARPLDCGCERFLYGLVLENAGRYSAASEEFRRAVDMLALDENSQLSLADALSVIGRPDEAKPHFEAAIDLSRDPKLANYIAFVEAPERGDYAAGIKALQDPKWPFPDKQRSAFIEAFRALQSGDGAAKKRAVQSLLALPPDLQDISTIGMLAATGANHEAVILFERGMSAHFIWPSALWYRSARGMLDDPAMPGIFQRLGLMKYWRATRTRPDVCRDKAPPAFCRMI